MSKTYRLTQSIFSPTLYAKAGDIGVQDEPGGLYWFDNGRYYFKSATIVGCPDWFEEIEEENKSNDSFQWDDNLVLDFVVLCFNEKYKNKSSQELFHQFKQSHTPKPQAEAGDKMTPPQTENKPDWEIESIRLEFANSEPSIVSDRLVIYNFLKGDHRYSSYKIHSVKRLSDGEVFSVGDEVEYVGLGEWYNGKIDKIGICYSNKDEILFEINGGSEWARKYIANIHHPKKLPPQPTKLFTTEDGVDKFQGDDCYAVDTNEKKLEWIRWFGLPSPLRLKKNGETEYCDMSGFKYFHTSEAAEKYIADNKPQPQKEEQLFGDRPIFTPRQYEEYGERCFNAGRERFTEAGSWSITQGIPFQHATFQDYKNSKQ